MPLFARKPETDAVLECPHDGHAMVKFAAGGATIDRCNACGGSWFDAHELRRVTRDKELDTLASHLPMVKALSPFACPRCGGACVEGHVSEVEVDTCTSCHGVWLDRGELAEAQRILRADRLADAAGPGFRGFLARL